jgi:hypothetical protein
MVFPATQVITELGGNLRHKMLIESDLFLRRQLKNEGIIARLRRHRRRTRCADRRQRGVEAESRQAYSEAEQSPVEIGHISWVGVQHKNSNSPRV